IQLLQHAWRQGSQGFVEQYGGGGPFGGVQRLAFQGQPQRCASLAGEAGQYRRQPPGASRFPSARMASASAGALACRGSATSLRRESKAASRRAPRISPALATKLAASSRASRTSFMPLIRLVTSEVKLTLRSTALMTILLVATRVCAWVALANSARAAAVVV